jgi:hypothetical protein
MFYNDHSILNLSYIEENCVLPPLDKPTFDQESGLWEMYFEERLPDWYKRGVDEHPDLITLHYETYDQCQEVLDHIQTLLTKEAYETTKQNQEPVLS